VYEVADYHGGSIYALAWHSKGYLLATGSNDKTIQLTRIAQGEAGLVSHAAPRVLQGHTGTVRCVAWCERMGAAHLVSGGAGDCMVRQWDSETGECVVALAGHHDHVQDMWYFSSLLLLLLLFLQFLLLQLGHHGHMQDMWYFILFFYYYSCYYIYYHFLVDTNNKY
jgi:WD40 repeat protein